MTKAAALHSFYSSFGLATYEESSVPTGDDAPAFPYLTYNVVTDSFGPTQTALTCSVWYRESTWVNANAKAEEISAAIGRGGKLLHCDGGVIWLMRGTPFAQSMGDESDNMIKRKVINITADYITKN